VLLIAVCDYVFRDECWSYALVLGLWFVVCGRGVVFSHYYCSMANSAGKDLVLVPLWPSNDIGASVYARRACEALAMFLPFRSVHQTRHIECRRLNSCRDGLKPTSSPPKQKGRLG
jgi:hypothetical protein